MRAFIFILSVFIAEEALAQSNIDEFKWKNRVIVLRGNSDSGPFISALDKLEEARAELKERDVVILKEKSQKFGIILYGKDGGKKWTGEEDFKVSEITQLIDQMPMRKDEMRR